MEKLEFITKMKTMLEYESKKKDESDDDMLRGDEIPYQTVVNIMEFSFKRGYEKGYSSGAHDVSCVELIKLKETIEKINIDQNSKIIVLKELDNRLKDLGVSYE